MKINSIRHTLLLVINSIVIVLFITTGVITYFTAHHEMDEIFDAQLAQYARMIDQLVTNLPSLPADKLPIEVGVPNIKEDGIERSSAEERRLEGHKYEEKLVFQAWSAAGQLILRSKNSENESMIAFQPGYHEIIHNGQLWYLYCVNNKATGHWIITGQRDDVRKELSLYLAFDQLIPLSIALIPVALLIWLSVNWGLKPIRELSSALAKAKPSQLKPLDIQLPVELITFQHSVNNLLDDLNHYLEKEKRFIANASHELRTPLSILLIHADNIKSANNTTEVHTAADAILISTRRLTHLVNQLMEMEKLEETKNLTKTHINLTTLINDSFILINEENLHQVVWSVNVEPHIEIYGNLHLLHIVLRNIFDNAAKYSELQSTVNVTAQYDADSILLTIENHVLPGIKIDTERMGERFYRDVRHQKIHGSGLGLSIVKKIISMHGGQITYKIIGVNKLQITIQIPFVEAK